jgi:tRNA pseudouridine38-40 synthase
MAHRYFIELSYKGTAYHGWQNQPNGISVQEKLENALSLILGEPIAVTGCGRTDAGVHAKYFVAHFDSKNQLSDIEKLIHRFNNYLPHDLVIHSFRPVDSELHARFDAISRSYEYHLITFKDAFLQEYAFRPPYLPDFDKMNEAAKILLNHTNFESFSKSKTDVRTYICRITRAEWVKIHEHHWVFHITADRFLRNMVRAIVGTLIEVGKGRMTMSEFEAVINAKNRSKAGMSVPGKALFLTDVQYDPEKFKRQV